MQDPYATLGLEHTASESEIRTRYLELVRKFPPEHEPAKAAEIRAAYDVLRDPIVRLRNQLFDVRCAHTLESLINERSTLSPNRRLPTRVLLSLGES
ncbi:MAG: J domain-containing protein [Planctomycetota bacterium]